MLPRPVQFKPRCFVELRLTNLGGVSSSGLEDGILRSEVRSGDEARSSNEAAGEVVDDGTVEVSQDDDVKLPRVRHQLHAAAKRINS